eukprot:1192188-Prorocentrum_minimum.AAC.2
MSPRYQPSAVRVKLGAAMPRTGELTVKGHSIVRLHDRVRSRAERSPRRRRRSTISWGATSATYLRRLVRLPHKPTQYPPLRKKHLATMSGMFALFGRMPMFFKGTFNTEVGGSRVVVGENEPAESAIRRFRRAVMQAGVIPEVSWASSLGGPVKTEMGSSHV